MKKYVWLKICLLLLLWLPLKSMAQYDSIKINEADFIRQQNNPDVIEATADSAVNMNTDSISESSEYEEEAAAYEMRHIQDSLLKELKANKKLQYYDIEKAPPKRNTWLERLMVALFRSIAAIRFIVMILLLIGLGLLVYWYMKTNGMSFFRKPKLIEGLEEIQEEELHSAGEYQEKINAAVAAGDMRQAIRWWYLYTLFQLAGREMIVPGREKTNNDYLRNMRSSPYYKKFAALTLDYEYIWYGGFDVSEDNFRNINQEFRDFNNAIGKAS
ncbi:DUF4129 domain-containing protein [Chitinophaga sp. 22321]|uniref:DUF4129 domain-containing protein n=1 Tax=Chitinophaga hostae TaxID=2831022 RepID=A0ABS5IWM7_9BACT|nr:DUF4129 domain-containing protein [Chitinophaga hostae]MBS0026637.1 DUF4129 domain-containing protein [Chitinophaga hostae]